MEGQTVHLESPKNYFASDKAISSDVPIFATGQSRIVFGGRGNSADSMKDDVMAARWIVFELFTKFQLRRKRKSPYVMSNLPNWH